MLQRQEPVSPKREANAPRLRAVLREVWGYDSFRPLQLEAMEAVLNRRDSLVVLPTGGGKSICFQAPALLREGTAVVISPLISLMRDQVAQLAQAGVEAGCLHSGQPNEERINVLRALDAGRLKLLYVSPERIASENIHSLLGHARLSFVAVDEAHCVSMWGHDFRPEYRQLSRLREQLPDADFHGYTATATREVSRDIAAQLALRGPEILRGSFDRPNLFYSVKPRRGGLEKLLGVVRRHPGESGIVYCISRKETEKFANSLNDAGFLAVPYHAGMGPEDRIAAQEAFVADRVHIVVATVAFGMGINKPDVRYVVHMGMPKSLENYQQESGRAGRDGLPSECLLLYSMADLMTWKKIGSDAPAELRRIQGRQLDAMHGWASGTNCRRAGLLAHFGEQYHRKNCGSCDICTGGHPPLPRSHTIAQMILSCVVRLEEKHSAGHTCDVLRGSAGKAIQEAGHDRLTTYGLLKEHSRNHVADWIEQLRDRGHLASEDGAALRVTEKGWEILRNRETGHLMDRLGASKPPPKAVADSLTPAQAEEFERLRKFRKEVAERENVPPYMVFGDVTLRDMVQRRPRNMEEFGALKGVGRKKREAYGGLFLNALWEGNPPPADEEPMGPPRIPRAKGADPKGTAMHLFSEEFSIEEVAGQIGRAPSTTEGYLIEYLANEGIADPSPWVPEDLRRDIETALDETPDTRLRPVFEALEGRATYGQIRIVLACRGNRTV